jgi:S1-C subfamily serine protease
MKKKICCSVALVVVLCVLALEKQAAIDSSASVVKKQERYTCSIALEFSKKHRSSIPRALSLLAGIGPNAYATGFIVDDRLVMTSYHVVSGKLSSSKKRLLGFRPDDELEVKAYVNGCRAKVLHVDENADLALLRVCSVSKPGSRPVFETEPSKNERLLLIAQPGDYKMVRRGVFHGMYTFRGQQYWSIKIDGRDGFSGSPVYNDRSQVVGVFSGYDWQQEVAFISPGAKAQQLLAEYDANVVKTTD